MLYTFQKNKYHNDGTYIHLSCSEIKIKQLKSIIKWIGIKIYESSQKNSIDKQEKVIGTCNSIDEPQISKWFCESW